jgi:hypothetical protein
MPFRDLPVCYAANRTVHRKIVLKALQSLKYLKY